MLTIGLFLGSTEDSYGQNILSGLDRIFSSREIRLLVFTSGSLRSYHGFEAQRNVLYRMVDRENLDALIITGAISHHISSTDLIGFCADFYPLPLITLEIEVPGVPGVHVDNYMGMSAMMDHLISLKRFHQFFHLSGPRDQQEAELRKAAFLKAIDQAGIDLDQTRITEGDYTIESGLSAAAELSRLIVPGESVVVCANDSMAVGLMEGLTERGFSIPGDVGVTGFDDSIDARYAQPPLSTVRQSTADLAARAAQLALEIVDHKSVPAAAVVKIAPELIIRSSCSQRSSRDVHMESASPDDMESETRLRLATERKLNQLRLLSEALITSIKLSDVLDVLAYELPALGINSCYLSIFEETNRESRRSRLLFEQRDGVRRELPKAGVSFDTISLLPGGLKELSQSARLVIVEALYSKDEKLGFVVFITDRISSAVTGTIRSLLSGALQSVLLLDERGRNEKQLLEYQERLREGNRKLINTLSSLQNAQKLLEQSEKMAALGQMVAGVTHDLRTPLGNALTASSHMHSQSLALQKRFEDGSMTRSDLAAMLELFEESSRIVAANLERAEQLLGSFKQVAADQAGEGRRRFPVRQYLDQVILSLKPQWKSYDLKFTISGDEQLVLDSYPGAFSQIITNLLTNSLKYALNPGRRERIDIDFRRDDKQLCLVYRDSGPGIPGEHGAKIFQPFFTTGMEQGGTGLGLSIVYNLATSVLGGEISLVNPGEPGACFELRIPLSVPGPRDSG